MEQALIGIAVAGLALLGVLSGHILVRVHQLEAVVERQRNTNRALWAYCRRLLDSYYRHRRDGSPDPDPLPDDD